MFLKVKSTWLHIFARNNSHSAIQKKSDSLALLLQYFWKGLCMLELC